MLDTPDKSWDRQITEALPRLKAFAISLCRDLVRAEDLVQETVLKACIHRSMFEPGTNFEAWLTTILRNHYFSQFRKNKRLVEDVDGAIAGNTAADNTAQDEDSSDELEQVKAVLETLPKKQREALEAVASGLQYDEVAEKLQLEEGTVKSAVNRARSTLRDFGLGEGRGKGTKVTRAHRQISLIGGGSRFRRIDASIFTNPPAFETEIDAQPKLLWLPLTRLFIDESYQRLIGGKGVTHIYRIAKEFDWKKFAAVVCAKVGDKYAIVDGQHRTYAAALRGIEEIPCLVIEATTEEQAASFAAINARTVRINELNVFAAEVAAGDKDALAIKKACDAAAVTICRYKCPEEHLKPRQTLAIGTLKMVVRIYSPKVLTLALRCIVARHHSEVGILRAPLIRAMSDVVARLDTKTPQEMISVAMTINFQKELFEAKIRAAQKAIGVRHELLDALLVRFGGEAFIRAAE